jgi:hypothetical protein
MALLSVSIKHSGKTYPIELDPSAPPTEFKDAIYKVTGVPPDRMKVMIKGGYLKVRYILLVLSSWTEGISRLILVSSI